jgi:hypothetical protein
MRDYTLKRLRDTVHGLSAGITRPNDAWLLDGTEDSSGEPLRLLYVGSQIQKNYIAHLAFGAARKETAVGRRYLWALRGSVKQNSLGCSLAVIECHRRQRWFCEDRGDFFVPQWLCGEVDVPLQARGNSAREDLRRIKRSDLQFIVTKELDEFDRFYHRMYLPYVTERHQDRAIAMGYDHMMRAARRGACELLLVKKGDESVAGMVIRMEGQLPRLWSQGLKDGDRTYLKYGALAATWYFASLHLRDKGFKRMHMGLSRSFLRDGVLRYKAKWGSRVRRCLPVGFVMKLLSPSPGLKSFLLTNPFAHLDKGQLWGAVFVQDGEQACGENLERLWEQYGAAGLSGLRAYECSDTAIRLLDTIVP